MRLDDSGQVQLVRSPGGALLVRKQAALEDGEQCRLLQAESEFLQRFQALAEVGRTAALPRWRGFRRSQRGVTLFREFVAGRTLAELISQGPLMAGRVSRWMAALAELLQRVHAEGSCHGDISSSNVVVTPQGQLVLCDLGGAGRATPPFAAPELLEGEPPSPATDLYALGALWLQALLGQLPFDPDVPGYLPAVEKDLLRRCLSSDPRLRPGADELVQPGTPEVFPHCLGRTETLTRLELAWQKLTDRQSCWLGLPAVSGAGKTELMREACARFWPSAWGQASTLSSPTSFGLFQTLSRARVFTDLEIPAEWAASERWQLLLEVFPALQQAAPSRALPAGALAVELLAQAWSELLQLAAQRLGRLLLVFDDVQWMDDSSALLLTRLSQRNLAGVLALVSWREENYSPPAGLKLGSQLILGPLDRASIGLWLQRSGVALSSLELDELTRWSQGSPLLLRYWLSSPERSPFSGRVRVLLEQRLDQLTGEQQAVLQTGALLGKTFPDRPLLSLFGEVAAGSLERAVSLQLVMREGEGHQFVHDRIRELCLEALGEKQKGVFHARLGNYYLQQFPRPFSECAYHLAQAGHLEAAAPLALEAAREEMSRLAYHSARQFYEVHLSQPHYLETWLEYLDALEALNLTALARQQLLGVLPRCRGPEQKLTFLERLCDLSSAMCDFEGLAEHARLCLQVPGVRGLGLAIFYSMVSAFHRESQGELQRTMPMLLLYCSLFVEELPVMSANAISGLTQLGLERFTRGWSKRLRRKIDFQRDPKEWCLVTSRLALDLYAKNCLAEHVRLLQQLEHWQERHCNSFEVFMTCLQLGMFAANTGHFAEVRRLALRLDGLALEMGNQAVRDTALLLHTEACGGVRDWPPLQRALDNPAGPRLGYIRAMVAVAQVCLRRGQPDQAVAALDRVTGSNAGVDWALLEAWRATAARAALEKTPRSQPRRREKLRQLAWSAIKRCLKLASVARLFTFQALRERAWMHLEAGQEELARQDFGAASQGAAEYGVAYQEALSRLAWGRAGLGHGWPEGQEQWQRARTQLRRLGAWWDLSDEQQAQPPLEELSELAQGFLAEPGPHTRARLEARGGHQLVQALSDLLAGQAESRLLLQSEQANLEHENEMWQSFLRHGPVAYERYDSRGAVLESNRAGGFSEQAETLLLEDGSRVRLEMPRCRWSYQRLDWLLREEQKLLAYQLERDWQELGPDRPELAEAWSRLQQWHLQEEVVAADFVSPQLTQAARLLDWQRLDALSRLVLRSVLGEIDRNSLKHGEGLLWVDVQWRGDHLTWHFQQAIKSNSSARATGFGFGIEGMRFRLSQVGGELSSRSDGQVFSLTLRLAARPPSFGGAD